MERLAALRERSHQEADSERQNGQKFAEVPASRAGERNALPVAMSHANADSSLANRGLMDLTLGGSIVDPCEQHVYKNKEPVEVA